MALTWTRKLAVGLIDARHRVLVSRYNRLRQGCEATISGLTIINQTLLDWLLKHVKHVDVSLGRFLAARTTETSAA